MSKSRRLTCPNCQTRFIARHANRKFCSDGCRHQNAFKQKTEKQLERRKQQQKKWRDASFLKRREYMLRYNYGITQEQYEDILQKQNGACAVCERHHSEFPKLLAVDHDHHTSEVRGLLCSDCNKYVIGKQRDPAIFERAGRYLTGPFTGWFVPEKKKKRKKRGRKNNSPRH